MLKKSLKVILLALFIFQVIYAQEVEAESEVEGEIGEANPEEEVVSAGGKEWKSLNITQALLDYRYRELFDFGEQLVISQLIGYDIVSNSSTWDVSKINFANYTSNIPANIITYAINSLFKNAEGSSFTAEVVIETNAYLTTMKIKAVSYTLGKDDVEAAALETAEEALNEEDEAPAIVEAAPEGEPSESVVTPTWTVVSNEEAQNDETLKGYIDEGVKYAITKGATDGGIHRSYTDWKVASLQLVRMKVVKEITTYAFYVNLTDDEYQKANVVFFVVVNPDNSHFLDTSGVYYFEDFMPTS